jgi:hypothetical protein
MALTKIFPALIGAALLLFGGVSTAAEYRADEFLGLDLSKAVLSPKPLGPAPEFAPVPVQAKSDLNSDTAQSDTAKSDTAKSDTAKDDTAKNDTATREARAEPKAAPRRGTVLAHLRPEKPYGAAETKLAHRHGNPLDAQALDTRSQTWPCKSGGICNWKR